MFVWIVWECIYDWPENGGGNYLARIFQNKEDAEKYCEQMSREAKEDEEEEEYISYCIERWPLY